MPMAREAHRDRTPWYTFAACQSYDPEWWFEDATDDQNRMAIAICSTCVVNEACLEYSVTHRIPNGIWGGMTPYQRKRWAKEIRFAPNGESKPIIQDIRKIATTLK